MPDFFDEVMGSSPAQPANKLPSPINQPNDFFSQVQGVPRQTSIPGAQPIADDEPSWWDKNGRMIEGAAAAGIGLLFGPKLIRGMGSVAKGTGTLGEATQLGAKNVQAIMAPSTVDEAAGRAAATTRAETGFAAQKSAQAETSLEPFWQAIGAAGPTNQRKFIQYVEGRSKGVPISDPKLQPLADEMKSLFDEVHSDMGTLNRSQRAGFIEDYYRHQWVRDEASERIFSKEGSKSFIKERSIPTIEQGIAMGLTPRTLDPVQTTLEYVTNARRFIASNKILQEGERVGDVIFRPLGSKAKFPANERWVPIEGALGKKGGGQLYAKEGWARVYNNWRSPGFTGAAGDVMHTMRRTSNAITGMELGLSGFHFTTMVNEAIINDVAKAVTDLAGGHVGKALQGLVKSPTAPVRLYKEGKELENVYLGKTVGSRETKEMSDLLTAAGGRAKGMGHAKDYEYTAMGDFFTAWKRGALKSEFEKYGEGIKAAPLTGTAKAAASLVGRTMQTVMYPLFNKYIPRIKTGAFYDTMGQWLRVNPTASRAQKEAQARIIWDSIDNRFGESVNDNVFWKQHMKQIAMLSMRSYSWNLGTIREIGGGAMDIAKHKMTPRAAYVIALPIVYGTIGALYQKMKTGENPQDLDDLIAPRTGGEDPATGLPERMVMPGYMKDVFGWYHDPAELAKHKLSTFLTTIMELGAGKDWRGAPIAPPAEDPGAPYEETVPEWLKAYMLHVGSKLVPISMRDVSRGEKQGSNLTFGERLLGMQPGGRKYIDPQGLKSYKRYRELRDWRSKEAFDARQESYYGGTE